MSPFGELVRGRQDGGLVTQNKRVYAESCGDRKIRHCLLNLTQSCATMSRIRIKAATNLTQWTNASADWYKKLWIQGRDQRDVRLMQSIRVGPDWGTDH